MGVDLPLQSVRFVGIFTIIDFFFLSLVYCLHLKLYK